jgi:hypothetical protein
MPCTCVYIQPLPSTSGSHVEGLNCNLLLRVPLLLLECLADRAARASIPSFPAVERVTELVPRVWGDSLTFDDDAV